MPKVKQKNIDNLFGLGDGYKLVFEKMTDAAALHKIVLNQAGKPIDYIFVKVNPAFEKQTGLKEKNIIGKKVTTIIPGIEKDPADWIAKYGKIAGGGNEQRFIQYAEGLNKAYEVLAYSPQKGYFVTIFQDVTGEKKVEIALTQSREKLVKEKELLDNSINAQLDTFFVFEPKTGKALKWNDNFSKVTGYTNKEISELKAPNSYYGKEDLKKAQEYIKNVLNGKAGTVEIYLITKKGKKIPFEYKASIIKGEKGEDLIISVGRDIAEKKKAEEKLRESEESFRGLMEQSPLATQIMDLDGKIIFVNNAYLRLWGVSRKDLASVHKSYNIFKDDQVKKLGFVPFIKKAFGGETVVLPPFEYEPEKTKAYKLIGRKRWIQSSLYSLKEGSGKIKNVVMVHEDITERKKYEKELELYEKIIEHSSNEIALADTKGIIVFVNDSWAKNHGYKKENLIGKSLDVFHPKKELENIEKFNKKLLKNGKNLGEIVHKRKNGEEYTALMNNFIIYKDKKPELLVAMATDISDEKKAQEELLKEKNLSEATINSLPGVFYVFDDQGKFLKWNKNFEKVVEYSSQEMAKASALDFFRGKEKEYIASRIKEAFTKGVSNAEAYIVSKSGKRTPYYFTAKLMKRDGVPHLVGMGVDITEKKQAQMKLEESEKKYSKIIEEVRDLIWSTDMEGNLTFISPNVKKILGYDDKDLYGKPCFDLMTLDSKKEALKLRDKFKDPKIKSISIELGYINKRGKVFDYDVLISLEKNQDGIPIAVHGVSRDITEKKKVEKQLNEQKKLLEEISESAIDTIFSKDMDRKYTFVNVAMEKLVGLKRKDLIGKTPEEVFSKDVAQAVNQVDALSFSGKQVDEYVDLKLNKKKVVLHVVQGPLRDEKNNVIGVSGVVRDVTKEKSSERTLMEERKRSSQYLEVAPVIIIALDAQGRVTLINKKGAEILGYKDQELIGQDWFACCLPSAMVNPVREVFEKLIKGQSKFVVEYENPVVTKCGREKLINWNNTLLKDENGKVMGILSSGVDVTEKKKIELALKESEERFRDVALSSSDWLWEVNTEGQYTYVSSGVKKVLGYTPKELLGKTPYDLMTKNEAQRVGVIFQKIVSGKKKIIDLENWNITKDGKKILFLTNGVPVFDSEGKWLGYRGVDKDITEAQASKERLRKHTEELERINRLMIGREKKMSELKEEISKLR